jgi:hypothetical protein
MPTSRSRKRTRRRVQLPPAPPPKAPPPTIRRILASWWVRALALVGLLSTTFALANAYSQRHPDVRPSSDAPTEFRIENTSPLFDMTDMKLVCNIESAVFETDRGRVGFSLPVTSGSVNTAIPRKSVAHYPCDASSFMTFTDKQVCLVGLCNDRLGISPASVHLTNQTLRIGMSYRIWGVRLEHPSAPFTWDGHHWHEGPALR